MDSITRVVRAIRHQAVDRPPKGELVIDPGFAKQMRAHVRGDILAAGAKDIGQVPACCRILGLDAVCVGADTPVAPVTADGPFVFLVVNGCFQTFVNRIGLGAALADIAADPAGTAGLVIETFPQVATTVRWGIQQGVNGIIIADDIAYTHGTYMSPDFIAGWLAPNWKRQTALCRKAGIPVFFHSDGNYSPVLDVVVKAGFDGIQCLEASAGMTLKKIKKKVGNRLCLMGHIPPSLLYVGDGSRPRKQRIDLMKQSIDRFAGQAFYRTGFIWGTAGGLTTGMSPELVYYLHQNGFHRAASQSGPGPVAGAKEPEVLCNC